MSRESIIRIVSILAACAAIWFCAPPVRAAEVEAMAKISHGSDIARGCPFECDTPERQYDSITGGITITAGKKKAWEIDMSHGFKWLERGAREGGTEFSVRFYPGRLRR